MTVLIFAIFIATASLLQKTDARFFVACAYSIVNLLHYIVADFLPDWMYHGSSAIANIAIMWWILQISEITETAISLLRVCLLEVIVNAAGWAAWFSGYSSNAYNLAYVGIYLWVMIILLRKDKADDSGRYKVDSWADIVRYVINPRHLAISRRSVKA